MKQLSDLFVSEVQPDAHFIGDLAGQADIYLRPGLPQSIIGRGLLALGEKEGTEIGPYRAEITFPDFGSQQWDLKTATKQIEDTLLPKSEKIAREVLSDEFGFDTDLLADYWLSLWRFDPVAANFLMEGRLAEGLKLLPVSRWPEIASKLKVGPLDVRQFLSDFILLWVANDLRIAGEAAHVKIYTPTGIAAIDGPDPMIAPMIDGVSKRLKEEIDLYNRAQALVKKLRPGEKATKKETLPFKNRGLDRKACRVLRQYRRAVNKDGRISRAEFEELVFLRLQHSRRAVRRVAAGIRQARSKKPGSTKTTVNHGRPLYSLQIPDPLQRLYIACRYAAGTYKSFRAQNGSEGSRQAWAEWAVDVLCGVTNPLSHPEFSLESLPQAGLHEEAVRTLFYIIRNTVVMDPTHLPLELGRMDGRASDSPVRSNFMMQRKFGLMMSFTRIWDHYSRHNKYDSGQTDIADSLQVLMGKKQFEGAMSEARRCARGTILQRLTDPKLPQT